MKSRRTTRTRYSSDFARARWAIQRADGANEREVLRGAALVRAWGLFLGQVAWQVFVTLTFDPKRVYPVGQDRAVDEAVQWCNDVARALRSPVAWVIAPERGSNGQWHAHVVMVGAEATAVEAVAPFWRARNGHINIQPVREGDQRVVALYASKEAAMTGAAVLSDTVHRYLLTAERSALGHQSRAGERLLPLVDHVVVELHGRVDDADSSDVGGEM